MAVIATGTVLAVRRDTAEPVVVTPPLPAITRERVGSSPPIEEVWPGAVRTVPMSLDDGTRLRPLIIADDRTTLMSGWSVPDVVYAYDHVTRTFRTVVDLPARKGWVPGHFLVAGDHLIWDLGSDTGTTLWRAPLAGGEARRITDELPHTTMALALAGDRIVYSAAGGGVYTIPVTGGLPAPVPGGDGLFLLEWPWAGSPYMPKGPDDARYRRLVDLETGVVSDAVVHLGEKEVVCGVTTCVGERPDGRAFVRGRDGSAERPLPELPSGLGDDRFMGLLAERSGRTEQYLVDVSTGRSGSLGTDGRPENRRFPLSVLVESRTQITYQRGHDYVFVDLRRIPSGS
ncbi:hypothetical protein HerbRD11066_15780 [Herbidospora sp. RD11066]